jgi:hypothetical protein
MTMKQKIIKLDTKPNINEQKKFVLPIRLSIDPMERLLVANFKNDPEFEMLEPQLFDDPINGKGLRILRYRTNKKVDVYWQPGVFVDRNTFDIGAGIGDFAETDISPAHFEITEHGVDLDIAFTDQQNRRIELVIKENTKVDHRFPFLAPVGNEIEKPKKLFLVDMLEFDFIKRKGTAFHAQIGDRTLSPSNFPISRDKQKVFFTRYASRLLIGMINPPFAKPVIAEITVPGENKIGEMNLFINGKQEVENIWVENDSDKIELIFDDGFPNLLALNQNKTVNGRWKYRSANTILTGGTYSLLRKGDLVDVELDVTQKWRPGDIPFSFKVFTCVVRSFLNWPKTYRWKAKVDLAEMTMNGHWERK